MSELTLFGPDFTGDRFENNSKENGYTHWMSSVLMDMLGYESRTSFNKAVEKAMTTCNTLGIPIMENFNQTEIIENGKRTLDFKLSRFACYLVAMNADNKKPAVAQAQAYFATLAGAVHNYLEEADKVERLVVRGEVSERENSLSGVVKKAGVTNYPFFQNAGYRGMYNKNIGQLRTMRGIPDKRSPLDFMGKDELAANLFRITQTELKIKQDSSIHGQQRLESAAEQVGRKVRQTMKEISGVLPEHLSKEEDIKDVKKDLKTKSREIKKIDSKKKK
jgi:DNA-damage-inducible protein D